MIAPYFTYLTPEFISLAMTVFLLGVKHGFDADHLAAIDGLARLRPVGDCGRRNRGARASRLNAGILFTLGHGAVVLLAALFIARIAHQWSVPDWLKATGAWISFATLFLLGVTNLKSAFARTYIDHHLPVKSGWTARLLQRISFENPAVAALAVGALFAISFDTLSQVSLFAMTAMRFDGVASAVVMSACFVVGMLLTDGINGLLIARLISRADRTARIASRVMTLAIALVSLTTAAVGLSMQISTTSRVFFTHYSSTFGVLFIGALVVSSVFGLYLARESRTAGIKLPSNAFLATKN